MRISVPEANIRIISDIHYGDRASAVRSLEQLAPLLAGTRMLICNGDSTDTRPGPNPEATAGHKADLHTFVSRSPVAVKFLTGNHDPDISAQHSEDLAAGSVFLTHGDILYNNIVPWGRDAVIAQTLVTQARRSHGGSNLRLAQLLEAHREAAATIPQRHQAEKHGLKYLLGFIADTVWPLDRALLILRAWREMPKRAQALLDHHRAQARFMIMGHTHRPGVWPLAGGRTLINTGSFCPPSGRLLVDLTPDHLLVRKIAIRQGDYHAGKVVAQFALTSGPQPANP